MKANLLIKTLVSGFFILGSFGFSKAQTTVNLPEQCDCDTAFLVQDTLLVVGKDTINLNVLDTHLDKVLVSNGYIYYYVNGMVVDSTEISEINDVGTGSGPPTVSGTEDIGEVYIDYATGDIWTFDGTTWVLQDGGVTTGTGAPEVTGTEDAGDVYVDNSTGDIWTFDGTIWVLQDGGVTTGTGAPAVAGTEDAGDVYVDNSTGDIWTFDGTTWVLQDGGVTTGAGAPAVTGTEDDGDIYIDNVTGDTYSFDALTDTWNLINSGDPQDLYWSTDNDSLLITNGEGVSVEDLGTNIVTTQIFNDSVVSIIYNQGDTLLDNSQFITNLGDTLLDNSQFITNLGDTLLDNSQFITNLGDTLVNNSQFITNLGDTLVNNSQFITNLGDTLLDNSQFITNLGDTLLDNSQFITNLGDTLVNNSQFITNLGDTLVNNSQFITNLGDTLITNQAFYDSVVSIVYNQGDTLLSNSLFTDSLYSFISDSLLNDVTWLTELSDSIDTDVDSLTLTGSDLTVYEDGVGYTVNLAGLATDPVFADSLLANNYFTDSLTSIIQDSLLVNETFITNLGDTLITNQAFYDSIVSIIYNEGDTLIENDTWVTELIDSLTQNNTYLTELRDSIDQQDLYWSAGNDSLLITNGEGISVEDLGTNIVTTQIFNDSVVSIIYNQGDTLLDNSQFITNLGDTLVNNSQFITNLGDTLLDNSQFITNLGDTLVNNSQFITNLGDTLVNNSQFITNLGDTLITNQAFYDSVVSIVYNQGDTLLSNSLFTDSLYSFISDSLLNDVTWLTELSDSIDTDVDSLTLTGSDLTVYEDGVGYTVNLSGLATDPAFADSLLTNNYFTDSLTSIIQDSLLANETFITNLGDTLITNQAFYDSIVSIIYNEGDTLIENDTWVTELIDSLTQNNTYLTELRDSIDQQDLYWSAGNDSLLITNGEGISVEDLGTNIVTTQIFNDSVVSIIYNQGDTLLDNSQFITNLGDTLLDNSQFITNLGDTLLDNSQFITNLGDTLVNNSQFITNLGDTLVNNSQFITNLGDTLITNQAFYDSVVSIVYNQGDTLLSNSLFTDSLYSFISDSLLNDVTWLTELSDSIDTDVDSLTLTGSDLTVYEDGVGYTVNLSGLATDPAFADSLLTNNYFTDSLTSIIQDSLLANETFITNLGDTLITNQAFYDSIVSIIYNEGDTLIENDTWVTELIDSLTQNNTYLTELRDSIDQQDLYWSAGNDSLLITNGEGISVEDLGTNIVTTQIFNDSVVSIIYNQGDTLLDNSQFITNLGDTLLDNSQFITNLGDTLVNNSQFITNLGDTLITNQAFYDSVVSIVYNQGDTLLSNSLFTDSLYSFISDSLLNDVTWLTELSDSIDTDVDSLTLTGSDLTVYEDGVGYTVNLAGLATDPAFADSLLANNYFTDSLTSIIQDSLLVNETFITNLGDTLITNQAFYDSIVSIIYNEGDTLIENDTWVTELIDSLTQNNTYLTELRDSIDQQDLYWSVGNDSLLITNGEGVSVEDLGTNIVTTQIFNDSVVSIIYNQGDTLLDNPLFTDSLYSFISDSLLNDVTWLTELSDSIDTDVDSLTLTGSDLTVYEDGVGYTVNLSGLATDPAFSDSLLTNNYYTDSLISIIQDSLLANETFITNLGDTLINNEAFTDSIYSFVTDSIVNDNTFLSELQDSIDTHLDSVVNNGDTALIYYVAGVPIDTTEIGGADADWNINNINGTGLESAPAGDNEASGAYALAAGETNIASGDWSVAIGEGNEAVANNAIAIGRYTYAEGIASTALGNGSSTYGFASTAIGNSSFVNGNSSVAIGFAASADGDYSVGIGYNTRANGNYSTAIGNSIRVEGNNSFGIGLDTIIPLTTLTQSNTMAIMGGVVGIGTVSPDNKLHVAGDVKIEDMVSGAVTDSIVVWSPTDSVLKVVSAASIGGTDADWTGAGTGTMIQGDTTDQVVIGSATASPGKALTVAGDLKVTGMVDPTKIIFSDGSPSSFDPSANDQYEIEYDTRNLAFTNSTSDSVLYLANNSNVGVGITTPGALLQVNGTVALGAAGTDFSLDNPKAWGVPVATGVNAFAQGMGASATGHSAIAMGVGATASGDGSFALGKQATASGGDYEAHNIAIGPKSISNGTASIAMGPNSYSSGDGSIAIGREDSALTVNSVAIGVDNMVAVAAWAGVAIGNSNKIYSQSSVAIGGYNDINSIGSYIFGYSNTADGYMSSVLGVWNYTQGNYSTAMGYYTKAESYISTAAGGWNIGGGSNATLMVSTDPLFEIGNGNNITRSNAFTVLKNGNTRIGSHTVNTDITAYKLELVGTSSTADRKMGINGTQVVYLPDQTAFPRSIVYGNGGNSFAAGGFDNTLVGIGAGVAMTTSWGNTAVGSNALSAVTTDGRNTAVGGEALRYNTGAYNTAVGHLAGKGTFGSSTGLFNTLVGAEAGAAITTGTANSFFGDRAGNVITDGSNNMFIGAQAGVVASSASNNTIIGHHAGDNITTGWTNILIGYDIDAQNATGSNQLSIGNVIFGSGGFGTGTTVGTGNIGIGVPLPSEKLEVAGNVLVTGGSFIDDGTTLTAPDYVFESYFNGSSDLNSDYKMKSLKEVETFIEKNKHLPGVQTAYDAMENGWDISKASRSNLEKIEELYLHTIEQQNLISNQLKMIKKLEKRISELENR